jgi:hypothetical protein
MTDAVRISDIGSLQGMKVWIRSGVIGDSNQFISYTLLDDVESNTI